MGTPISKVRAEVKAADALAKQQMEERLNILEKMLHSRLENEMSKILSGQRGDQEIHAGTIVELHKKAYITESEQDQGLEDAIWRLLPWRIYERFGENGEAWSGSCSW